MSPLVGDLVIYMFALSLLSGKTEAEYGIRDVGTNTGMSNEIPKRTMVSGQYGSAIEIPQWYAGLGLPPPPNAVVMFAQTSQEGRRFWTLEFLSVASLETIAEVYRESLIASDVAWREQENPGAMIWQFHGNGRIGTITISAMSAGQQSVILHVEETSSTVQWAE
jgi:hypothetical protein